MIGSVSLKLPTKSSFFRVFPSMIMPGLDLVPIEAVPGPMPALIVALPDNSNRAAATAVAGNHFAYIVPLWNGPPRTSVTSNSNLVSFPFTNTKPGALGSSLVRIASSRLPPPIRVCIVNSGFISTIADP